MIILIWSLIIVILFLLTYIFYMKKEILNISNQLNDFNEFKTNKKIDVNLINKEVEALGESINNHIEIANRLRLNEVKSNDELKEMISSISHDLRTPLTSILGYIQMLKLKASSYDEKSLEYLNRIERKAKDLGVLLEDFFDLSIIENPDYNLNLEYINLNELLCDTLVGFYEELEEANIEPNIVLNETSKVVGDKKAIARIIDNLMSNAVKYSSKGVTVKLFEENHKVSLVFINDVKSGESIDTDKLFMKFYKNIDKSRTRKSTGLGLSIVKTLMEAMNGSVEAVQIKNELHIICQWEIG